MKLLPLVTVGSVLIAGALGFTAHQLRRMTVSVPARADAEASRAQGAAPFFVAPKPWQPRLPPASLPSSEGAAPPTPPPDDPGLEGASAGGPKPKEPAVVRKQLEEAFAADRSGSGDADALRSTAETKLRALLPSGSSLTSLECGASMCRIGSQHESIAAYSEFLEKALMGPSPRLWNGAFISVPAAEAANGKFSYVAFVARTGVLPVTW
jgi:hypothetical protein